MVPPAEQVESRQRGVAAAAEPAVNPSQKIGHWFLLCYIFLSLSRVLDVLGQLRIPAVLYVLIVVATLLSGGLFNIFRTKVGWALVLLTGWLGLTIPFSSWPGGSAQAYSENVKAFGLALAILAIPRTLPQTMQLLKVVAAAILGAAVMTWFYGRLDYGRLSMDAGTYSDPNQFAMTLLMALPLWVVLARQATSLPLRIAAYACVLPILITFLRTGSRGGLVGLAIMLAITFFHMSAQKKFVLAVSTVGLLGLSLLVLPDYLVARYTTLFSANPNAVEDLSAEESQQLYAADIGSSYGRLTLLMDSLLLTAKNPIFGVGVGQFRIQNWERRKAEGKPGPTMVTHNAYTEFSSEAGIPALLLFLVLLYQCFKANGMVVKMGARPGAPTLVAPAAEALRLSLVVLVVCSFFLSVAYSQLFYIMGAITARLYMTAMAASQRAFLISAALPKTAPPQAPILSRPSSPAPHETAAVGLTTPGTRSKLSPWRTSGRNHVRNSRLS